MDVVLNNTPNLFYNIYFGNRVTDHVSLVSRWKFYEINNHNDYTFQNFIVITLLNNFSTNVVKIKNEVEIIKIEKAL